MTIQRIVTAVGGLADETAKNVHTKMVATVIIVSLATLVMWGINVANHKGINLVLLYVGSAYIFIVATVPNVLFGVALAGAVVAKLNDKDASQGAVGGLIIYYRVIRAFMLFFVVVGGVLSTWQFSLENPAEFFVLGTVCLTIILTCEVYGIKTKYTPWIIIGYCIVVGIVTLYQGADAKGNVKKVGNHVEQGVSNFTNNLGKENKNTTSAPAVQPPAKAQRRPVEVPVEWSPEGLTAQGTYIPQSVSKAWSKPNPSCDYEFEPGIGRWYEVAVCADCRAENLLAAGEAYTTGWTKNNYDTPIYFRAIHPDNTKSGLVVRVTCPS